MNSYLHVSHTAESFLATILQLDINVEKLADDKFRKLTGISWPTCNFSGG